MSFVPALPLGGYAGWKFLSRTVEAQEKAFDNSPSMKRDTDYFLDKIGSVETVDDLMKDRRLLSVALGAVGLGDQIDSTYMIRKVLTEGPTDDTALANKLSDKRWLSLAQSFDFSSGQLAQAGDDAFAQRIVDAFQTKAFQTAVGEVDSDLQLAMKIQSDLPALANASSSDKTKWYLVLGTPAMRTVFQTALGLPSSIVSLDIDAQADIFQRKTAELFGSGSLSQFSDPDQSESLIKTFLIRSELQSGAAAAQNSIALQLLQGGQSNAASLNNAVAAYSALHSG